MQFKHTNYFKAAKRQNVTLACIFCANHKLSYFIMHARANVKATCLKRYSAHLNDICIKKTAFETFW